MNDVVKQEIDGRPLWTRIERHLKESHQSIDDLARATGLRLSTVTNIRNGSKVQQRTVERVEAFLEGRTIEKKTPSPKATTALDPASMAMVDEIIKVAMENKRALPVMSEAIKKLWHSKPEAVETVVLNVLYAFLTTVEPQDRVTHLFQLHRAAEKD